MSVTGRRYGEASIGNIFTETLTITAHHLSLGAMLVGNA